MFYADDRQGSPEVRIAFRDAASPDAYDTAFGGSFTFAEDSAYDITEQDLKDYAALREKSPRTAVGILDDGRLALLAAGGGNYITGLDARGVFDIMDHFDISWGMFLDGGSSTQIVRRGADGTRIVDKLMRGANRLNEGRSIISALVVERFPTVNSVTFKAANDGTGRVDVSISGNHLTGTTVAFVQNCWSGEADQDGTIRTEGDSTLRTFSCFPGSPGSREVYVKDRKNGEPLYHDFDTIP